MAWLPNPNFIREMSDDSEHRDALVELGEEVVSATRSLSSDDTGEYDRRLAVTNRPGQPVRVEAFAAYSHILEWGSRYVTPQAPLRRGVRAAGLRLEEDPR